MQLENEFLIEEDNALLDQLISAQKRLADFAIACLDSGEVEFGSNYLNAIFNWIEWQAAHFPNQGGARELESAFLLLKAYSPYLNLNHVKRRIDELLTFAGHKASQMVAEINLWAAKIDRLVIGTGTFVEQKRSSELNSYLTSIRHLTDALRLGGDTTPEVEKELSRYLLLYHSRVTWPVLSKMWRTLIKNLAKESSYQASCDKLITKINKLFHELLHIEEYSYVAEGYLSLMDALQYVVKVNSTQEKAMHRAVLMVFQCMLSLSQRYHQRPSEEVLSNSSSIQVHFEWQDKRDKLSNWRASLLSEIEKGLTIQEQMDLQEEINQWLRDYIAEILTQGETLLSETPYKYALLAAGSLARGEATPYSDIEGIVLYAPDPLSPYSPELQREHLDALMKLFDVHLRCLGEVLNGIYLDEGTHFVEKPSSVLTVEEAIERYIIKGLNEDASDTLSRTMQRLIWVGGNDSGGLWREYYQGLEDHFTLFENHHYQYQWLGRNQWYAHTVKKGYQASISNETWERYVRFEGERCCFNVKQLLAAFDYLCFDWGLFFGVYADTLELEPFSPITPYQILEKLSVEGFMDERLVGACLKALGNLNFLRIKGHLLESGAGNWIPVSAEEQVKLKNILQGIIQPLYQQVAEWDWQGPMKIIEPAFYLLSNYLHNEDDIFLTSLLRGVCAYLDYLEADVETYLSFYDKLSERDKQNFLNLMGVMGKQAEDVSGEQGEQYPKKELVESLLIHPHQDGWHLGSQAEMTGWMANFEWMIESLVPIQHTDELVRGGHCIIQWIDYEGETKAGLLKTEVLAQLFSVSQSQAKLRDNPEEQRGRHRVLPVNLEGFQYWFKCFPENPGMEQAIYLLSQKLTGEGVVPGTVVKIQHPAYRPFAAWVTPHQSGMTLDEMINESPELLVNLDPQSFTATLLRVLLTNPEDDKGDDYYWVPKNSDQFALRRIDNERAFYPVDVGGFLKAKSLQVKSIIYCLDQMTQPLDPQLLRAFMALDSEQVLSNWLDTLAAYHQGYQTIFSQKEVLQHFNYKKHFKLERPGPSLLTQALPEGLVRELMLRLDSIQSVCRIAFESHSCVTGLELLSVVQPDLFQYYQAAFEKYPVRNASGAEVKTRFLSVTEGLYAWQSRQRGRDAVNYLVSSTTGVKAMSQSLKLQKQLNGRQVIHIWQGDMLSPQQAKGELDRLKSYQLEEIQQAILSGSAEARRLFQNLAARHQQWIIKGLMEDINEKSEDYTGLNKRHILMSMVGVNWHRLSLDKIGQALTDQLLQDLLSQTGSYLIELQLEDCPQITSTGLRRALRHCVNLKRLALINLGSIEQLNSLKLSKLSHLTVKRCNNLTQMGGGSNIGTIFQGTLFQSDSRLKTQDLRECYVSDCPSLTTINLMAESLQTLACRNCENLVSVNGNLPELENLSLVNAPELHDLPVAPKLVKLCLEGCKHWRSGFDISTIKEKLEGYPDLIRAHFPQLIEPVILESYQLGVFEVMLEALGEQIWAALATSAFDPHYTLLHLIAEYGTVDLLAHVLNVLMVDINSLILQTNSKGSNVLHFAACNTESPEILQKLLSLMTTELAKALAHVNEDKTAPIHLLAWNHEAELLKDIIEAMGASAKSVLRLSNADDWSALHIVLRNQNFIAVEAVIASLGDLACSMASSPTANGWTPLHLAARYRDAESIKALLCTLGDQAKKMGGWLVDDGWSPLHLAIRYQDTESVKALLVALGKHAKKVAMQTISNGWTALHLAFRYGTVDVIQAILTVVEEETHRLLTDEGGFEQFYALSQDNPNPGVTAYLESDIRLTYKQNQALKAWLSLCQVKLMTRDIRPIHTGFDKINLSQLPIGAYIKDLKSVLKYYPVEQLNLTGCGLGDFHLIELLPVLASRESLTQIKLSNNRLTQGCFEALTENLAHLDQLHVELTGNAFDKKSIRRLVASPTFFAEQTLMKPISIFSAYNSSAKVSRDDWNVGLFTCQERNRFELRIVLEGMHKLRQVFVIDTHIAYFNDRGVHLMTKKQTPDAFIETLPSSGWEIMLLWLTLPRKALNLLKEGLNSQSIVLALEASEMINKMELVNVLLKFLLDQGLPVSEPTIDYRSEIYFDTLPGICN